MTDAEFDALNAALMRVMPKSTTRSRRAQARADSAPLLLPGLRPQRMPHIDVVLDVIRRAGSSGMSREQLSLIGTTDEQIAALVERGEVVRYAGKRLVWHGGGRDRADIERLAAEVHRQQPGLA